MRLAFALVLVVSLIAGCRPSTPRPAEAAPPAVRSPTQTLAELIGYRTEREYDKMYPLIVAAQRHAVVEYLQAVDEFLTANTQLCRHVRDHISIGLSQTIDQSRLAGNLSIFSNYVKLLDEKIDGDSATLSFQIGQEMPARRADLIRVNGQWLYDPGAGDRSKIVPAVRRMADGLQTVLRELRSGGLDPAAMREDPKKLIEAVRIRLLPGIKMLPDPPKSGDGG